MSTQQIPTVAQLDAARRSAWHQAPEQAQAGEPVAAGSAAPTEDDAASPELKGAAEEPQELDAAAVTDGGVDSDSAKVSGEEDDLGEDDADEDDANSDEDDLDDEDDAELDEDDSDDDADDDENGGVEDPDDEDAEDLEDEDDSDTEAEEALEPEPATRAAEKPAAVQTLEQAREMLNRFGLVLFQPHPAMANVPAPSFVEATLGRAQTAPSVAESATARSLMARLIAEGSAVPLNLLGAGGTTGEAPDFLASTAAFSYVFTLRGDKNWKQMPEPAGANKVSPLAMNTYALLLDKGPQPVTELVTELGKGLTEAAVLRALGELWQQLRVIPVLQQSGKPTVWEPIASRLIKQVKAGANAGAPTALSALISLYLAQSLLATEDEIETFLSPLSPRSRIRDVVHALAGAQELETITIEGRHHLHISGELPVFAGEAEERATMRRVPRLTEDGSRIKRMVPSTAPEIGRAKPFRTDRPPGRPTGRPMDREGRKPGGDRFAARPGGQGFRPRPGQGGGERPARFDRPMRDDRPARSGGFGEGRPPQPERAGGGDRPGGDRPFRADRPARFDRPWDEGKRRPASDGAGESSERRAPREFAASGDERRPARREGFRPAGGAPRGGDRPAFGRKPFERRPFERGAGGGGERPGGFRPRPDGPRGEGPGGEDRGSFRPRAPRPGYEGAGGGERQRGPGRGDGGFPPRRSFGGGEDRPARPFRGDEGGERKSFAPRPERGGDGAARGPRPPFRKFDAPRDGARPFRPARQEDGNGAERPRRSFGSDRGAGEGRPFRPGAPADRDRRPDRGGFAGGASRGGGDGARPGGKPFGAKPFGAKPFGARPGGAKPGGGKPFGAKPGGARGFGPKAGDGGARAEGAGAGPFDKFKGGNKPWGKRPPARKIRREGDES